MTRDKYLGTHVIFSLRQSLLSTYILVKHVIIQAVRSCTQSFMKERRCLECESQVEHEPRQRNYSIRVTSRMSFVVFVGTRRSPFRKSSFLWNRPPPSLMKAYRIQLTGGIGMFCDLYPVRNSINARQFNACQQLSCKLNRSKTERNCYVAYNLPLTLMENYRRGKIRDKYVRNIILYF